MKWKRGAAVLLWTLIALVVAVPMAVAQAPTDNAQNPQTGDRRIIDRLKRARRLQGTLRGKVSALDSNEFEVTIGNDATSSERHLVLVDARTVYRMAGQEEATFVDLQLNDWVVVCLVTESDNLAQSVWIVNGRQMRAIQAGQRLLRSVQRLLGHSARRGEIVAIASQSMTIETDQGQLMLMLGDETKVLDAEGQEIAINDLEVGDVIGVVGRPDPTAPIDAKLIRRSPERPAQD